MIKIGIYGNFNETAKLIENIFRKLNFSLIIFKCNKTILNSKSFNYSYPNILILNKFCSFDFNKVNIHKDCIIIFNRDCIIDSENIKFNNNYIISYGYKKSSDVTISSLNDFNRIQICVQKNLKSIFSKLIYQQEFPVQYYKSEIYSVLSASIVGLLLELDIKTFEKIFLNKCSKFKSF